jgi:hypothetical protein
MGRGRIGLLSVALGAGAAAALLGLYLGVVSLAGGPSHALGLLWDDRFYVAPIVLAFGVQAMLYARLRLLALRGRAQGALTAAGGSISTVGMVACCAHHVAELLPLLGLSAAATALAGWKAPLLAVGLAANLVGVALALRALRRMTPAARLAGAEVNS